MDEDFRQELERRLALARQQQPDDPAFADLPRFDMGLLWAILAGSLVLTWLLQAA
jgi:hypothetical protein